LQKSAFEELEGVLNMKANEFEERYRHSHGNGSIKHSSNGGGNTLAKNAEEDS
jgi:hypothetical protein